MNKKEVVIPVETLELYFDADDIEEISVSRGRRAEDQPPEPSHLNITFKEGKDPFWREVA